MEETDVFPDTDHLRFGHVRAINSPFQHEGTLKIEPNHTMEPGKNSCKVLSTMG